MVKIHATPSVKHINVKYNSRRQRQMIVCFTDIHWGAATTREDLIAADIEAVRRLAQLAETDETLLPPIVILNGDITDGINHLDPRYTPEMSAEWLHGKSNVFQRQADYAYNALKPIIPYIVGMVRGNHEDSVDRHSGFSVHDYLVSRIAEAKGVPEDELNFGVQSYLTISYRRYTKNTSGNTWNLNIYVHHGAGGASTPSGQAGKLEKVSRINQVDLVLMGHLHSSTAINIVSSSVQNGRVALTEQVAAYLPSYLDSHNPKTPSVNSYAEKKQLPKQPLGTRVVAVHPNAKTFGVMMSNSVPLAHTLRMFGIYL